jgi:CBS domain-containing protein
MDSKSLMKTDFVSLKNDEPITKLIGALKKTKQKAAVVLDKKGNYLGIATKHPLYRAKVDTSKAKLENITLNVATLKEHDSLETIAGLMFTSDAKVLAVIKNNKVRGIVHVQDVVAQLKQVPHLREMPANEIATKKLFTLPEDASLGQAFSLMREKKVNRLPVVDVNNELKGIVSFRNLMKAHLVLPTKRETFGMHGVQQRSGAETEKPAYLKIPLKEEMIIDVKTASPETKLFKLVDLLMKSKGSQIVLVENKKPVGIITYRDLLKSYLLGREGEETVRNIQFVGLPELDEIDRGIMENTVTKAYDKIEKIMNNVLHVRIHIKTSRSSGVRKKYEVKAQADCPGIITHATRAVDWSVLTAVQKAMSSLEREMIEQGKRRKF